jgi:protein-arginine kinase activator protein McsA
MTCERCRTAEAIVHLTRLADNVLSQRHLCRECAEAEGHPVPQPRSLTDWTVVDTLHRDQAT